MNSRFCACALIAAMALGALVTLIPASVVQGQTPSDAGAEEPNNVFGAAFPLHLGESFDAAIAPQGDVDWYTFSVENQGELALEVTNVPAALDIVVRVWNADKETVSNWLTPLAAGGDTIGLVDLAAPGVYFLEVADGSGDASSADRYTLRADFTPTADEGEPNNRFGDASPLLEGSPLHANILPANDADWYRFDATDAGQLDLSIGDVAEELAISVRIWNADGETISDWAAPLAPGGDTTAQFDLPSPGAYFLEVAGGSGQRSPQPYSLAWTFTPAGDAFEPNNRFGSAAWLDPGITHQATILPRGDVDWYRIAVPAHGELAIDITNVPDALDVDVRVWNRNKETVGDWLTPLARGGDTSGVIDLAAPGVYYLETVDGSGDARAVEPYAITVDFAAAADPFEPNNRFGLAADLALGDESALNILPRGDVDWFAFELPHHGELRVVATDVPEELDVNLRLWNANKETVSNWFTPLARGGDTELVVDLPQPGRYVLEVVDGSGDARSLTPFTLRAEFLPAADLGEPNNTFESAVPLDLDTTIAANILPANDADWYRIDVPESGDLHLLATHVPAEIAIALRVWNVDKQTLSNWALPLAAGGDTSAVVAVPSAGVYYAEVVDDRRGRSIEPFWLIASLSEIDPASVEGPALPAEVEPPNEGTTPVETAPVIAASETTTGTATGATETTGATASQGRKPPASQPAAGAALPAANDAAVTFDLPDGWLQQEGKETVVGLAETPVALAAEMPPGPRLRVAPVASSVDDALAALEEAESGAVSVFEEPEVSTVAGLDAVSIGLRESVDGESVNRRYLFVVGPHGEAWQIVLEAPESQWQESLPLLEEVLQSIVFDGQEK